MSGGSYRWLLHAVRCLALDSVSTRHWSLQFRLLAWSEVSSTVSAGLAFSLFFSSRRRHTIFDCDWSSDVCSSDLFAEVVAAASLGSLDVPHLGRAHVLRHLENEAVDVGKWRAGFRDLVDDEAAHALETDRKSVV